MTITPRLNDPNMPLVSVLVFNYNYGRYLRECLDSVLAQTYDNIEISFSDNFSTDDSWEIALEYSERYPGIMNITQNRQNFGSDANFANCFSNSRGKYFIELCSDDALAPEFVETCVNALEDNPSCGFAMVHRDIMDDKSNITKEPPFYNQSCIIEGAEQAAVYMMAAVNPSVSQIMYNKLKTYGNSVTGGLAGRWYGTRLLDFNMCCRYPIAYIKEPLLKHRLHMLNDSFKAAGSLMEIIGPYVLHHQFAETANVFGFQKVVDRLPESTIKVARLCLRYCTRALSFNDEKNAFKYYHLAAALVPEIVSEDTFKEVEQYWKSSDEEKKDIIKKFENTNNLITRNVSYDPPPNSIPLIFNKNVKVS